jgi:molybdopterin/thiamine biosynthesis adenylyltransferase
MVRLFQVGAGSGGIHVLDCLARDSRITHATIVDHDRFDSHNVERHLFGPSPNNQLKVELVVEWLRARRPGLVVEAIAANLCEIAQQRKIKQAVAQCDVGVCAVDNETAKFHFDALMREAGKPWTLGEVLSGGIGGLVHRFDTGGPCYGCVASHLRRDVTEAPPAKALDYSDPGATVAETQIPASKSAIMTIAGLHALVTLDLLDDPPTDSGFTTFLMSLKRVPGVFEEPYRPFRFRVPRVANCLVCGKSEIVRPGQDLDVALDEALARLENG